MNVARALLYAEISTEEKRQNVKKDDAKTNM